MQFPLADAKAMGLTPEQIRLAKAKGITSVIGLRILEKNTRRETSKSQQETP